MKRIGVLVSGGGTNLQALIDAQKKGVLKSGEIRVVISNRPGAYALTRARENGIKTCVVTKEDFPEKAFDREIIRVMKDEKIDLIVMAGFMSIVGEELLAAFEGRMINVHPSLIPSFCGEGFYGLRVHEAALARGVRISGATVHFVNGVVDGGPIIAQKAVSVRKNDTPKTLQRRVMEKAEWVILPRAVEDICRKL